MLATMPMNAKDRARQGGGENVVMVTVFGTPGDAVEGRDRRIAPGPRGHVKRLPLARLEATKAAISLSRPSRWILHRGADFL
jgi:hypothetical protein